MVSCRSSELKCTRVLVIIVRDGFERGISLGHLFGAELHICADTITGIYEETSLDISCNGGILHMQYGNSRTAIA